MTEFKTVPSSGPLFEAMMRDVDAKLASDGVAIESRPILAVREVSMLHKIPIPFASEEHRLPPEIKPYAPLSAAISLWYESNYGDRLKIDMKPGRTVVQLDRDLYILDLPRVLGSVEFCLTREFLPNPTLGRAPIVCNVVQLIKHMTPSRAARLTDSDLKMIDASFKSAMWAVYTLEATPHQLLRSARNDIATAVTALMDRPDRAGESKWASLQAAEKTLKAAIALHGGEYKHTHDLSQLAADLALLGVKMERSDLLSAIQCRPGIRYGQEPCVSEEALAAHSASLDLVNRLRDAGARFNQGLG